MRAPEPAGQGRPDRPRQPVSASRGVALDGVFPLRLECLAGPRPEGGASRVVMQFLFFGVFLFLQARMDSRVAYRTLEEVHVVASRF